jgi:hypothetical protein
MAELPKELPLVSSAFFCFKILCKKGEQIMQKRILMSVVIACMAMFLAGVSSADVPAPPVNQYIGEPDVANNSHSTGMDKSLGDPTVGDCTPCHGSLVEEVGDGHKIPTYLPSLVTPKTPDIGDPASYTGGDGLPQNSRGSYAGACDYCHDLGATAGIFVQTPSSTHRNSGLGSECHWCHDGLLSSEEQIRGCEGCHSMNTLHNIQADSPNTASPGSIVVGGEDAGYGHIGNEADCWGCHGFDLESPSYLPAEDSIFEDCAACHPRAPDIHHLLYGAPFSLPDDVPYPDADGDDIPDPTLGCLNCHGSEITVNRNCFSCHSFMSSPDIDSDSLPDYIEEDLGTDPALKDTDEDELNDGAEISIETDPLDPDSDGDWLHDGREVSEGTDPLDPDSDHDGYDDGGERFCGSNPLDRESTCEVCDNADNDLDGAVDEGLQDTDSDGVCDVVDTDDDNDGCSDDDDPARLVFSADTDGDGLGNDCDTDDDGDTVLDIDDVDSLDPYACQDIDADTCDDCIEAGNPQVSDDGTDTDSDGECDDGDSDDDNDGCSDDDDPARLVFSADTDGDGLGNDCDTDDDNDGCQDPEDDAPLVFSVDTDGDGDSNDCDIDDDDDGLTDVQENEIGTDPLDPDTDGDEVIDGSDICPLENATGLDADTDGCVDTIGGLTDNLNTLVNAGVIDYTLKNSLLAKIEAAERASSRENICAALGQLEALQNQVNAQIGNKISGEAAELVISNIYNYADNLIFQMKNLLGDVQC